MKSPNFYKIVFSVCFSAETVLARLFFYDIMAVGDENAVKFKNKNT